ncbi:hypothetical protein J6590_043634 [Homalodisca vitripennis]|nr:hypothetical protein J6590_043634 [Homalodisca vitripennis]
MGNNSRSGIRSLDRRDTLRRSGPLGYRVAAGLMSLCNQLITVLWSRMQDAGWVLWTWQTASVVGSSRVLGTDLPENSRTGKTVDRGALREAPTILFPPGKIHFEA